MSGKQRWSVNMGGQLLQVPMPVGYSEVASYTGGNGVSPAANAANSRDAALTRLRMRKMWEAARSPLSGVLMSAVMMYMVGNNIQIFPLIMIGMTCMNAVKGLFNVTNVFKPFSEIPFAKKLPAIIVYLVIASAHVGVALWKLDRLGFLPTTKSDWYLLLPFKQTNETAVGGVSYVS